MDEATHQPRSRPKSIAEKPGKNKTTTVMYCRLPSLLAQTARGKHATAIRGPLVVAEGRIVRDACSLALVSGVKIGASVVQARRLCRWKP